MFINEQNHIYVAMPMYNLVDYSDNCSETSGGLWQFKRDEVPNNNDDLTIDNSQSFKYEATLLEKAANVVNNTNSSVKIKKNSCSTKVSKQLMKIVRNSTNQLQN